MAAPRTSSFTKVLPPKVCSRLAREIMAFRKDPIDGMKYVPSDNDDLSEVRVLLDGPDSTPYEEGEFMIKLVFGVEYPQVPPLGLFLTKIYHPNISIRGDICVNTLKRDWTPDVSLRQILQIIRCLLIVPNPESSLNDEAGKLFMQSYEEYAARAKMMTQVHALKQNQEAHAHNNSAIEYDPVSPSKRSISSAEDSPQTSPTKLSKQLSPSKASKAQEKAKKSKQKSLRRL